MAFLETVVGIFTKQIVDELGDILKAEIQELKKALLEAYAKGQAFDRAREKGQLLKEELAQAKTDDEYKAILRKTNSYLDAILNSN